MGKVVKFLKTIGIVRSLKATRIDQGMATVLAAALAVFAVSYQLYESRQADILKDKKEAYLAAFESINDVLGNASIIPDGGTKFCPPSNPREYDLTKVRVAMDRLLLFSGDPIKSVKAYQRAIGILPTQGAYNPIGALTEFRTVAMRDLGKNEIAENAYLRTNGWIAATSHPSTKAMLECIISQQESRATG